MLRPIPKVQRVDALSSIGFYTWMDLTLCTLKGLRSAISFDSPLSDFAPTRALLVGRFHHRMMELAEHLTSIDEIDALINVEIERLQATVTAIPHLRRLGSVSGWDEINISATTASRIVRSASSRPPLVLTRAESDLYSNDRLLVGRPDYFAIRTDVAELKDYKTGALRTTDGFPVQRNVDQLRFYSALLFDNFQISRILGAIVGLNGDRCELAINREDASSVATLAKGTLADTNRMLDRDILTLAVASSTACHRCKLQVICPAFRSAQTGLALENGQMLLNGTVVGMRSNPRGTLLEVRLRDEVRNVDVAVGFPADVAADIDVGRSVCVSGLRQHGSSFLWSFDSQVYAND